MNWLFRKAPGPILEEPLILKLEPKEDMTAHELASIMRWASGIYPATVQVGPTKLRAFVEKIGEGAYRHFVIDESGEAKKAIERKASDLIGHELTTGVLAELTGRLDVADILKAQQAKRVA